jgi:branched-chain amino acid aminotransferase
LGIDCREADLDLYDAATADEIFMTSTSLCLCPVRSIGGRGLPGPLPGPVTQRLTEAYAHEVDCDFVAQYLRHLS